MRIRRTVALVVAGIFLATPLAACGDDEPEAQSTASPTTSVSSSALTTAPTPGPTETVVSMSPGPTKTVYTQSPEPTDEPSSEHTDEPSDEPTRPEIPEDNIRLSGTIIYVNRDENSKGKCGRVLDVVVDTSADDVRGIQAVHFHEEDGITILPEYREIGDPLDIVIPPDDFKPLLLEDGKEPFPPNSDMTRCDRGGIPDELYGQWIIRDLPYNGLTWRNP